MKKTTLTLEEIEKLRETICNVNTNIEHKKKLGGLEIFAMWVTQKVGTMGSFFLIFLWSVIWIGWNIFAPAEYRFDPYPGFILWLFISNIIQLFLMPLVMVGQNLQGRHAEARAEADFEINRRAEIEIGTIITHLENIDEILEEIRKKIN